MSKLVKVSDVIFRSDLYPRLETDPVMVQKYADDLSVLPPILVNQHNELVDGWHRWTNEGLELSFGLAFGLKCPESLRDLPAGILKDGQFFPHGSVASHFSEIAFGNQKLPPHIYFIRSVCGGPVKIGKAHNIKQRLATLQTSHPYKLEVIGIIPYGGDEVEKQLHTDLAQYRLMGEWFEWNPGFEKVFGGEK